jgi:hypothetical protein
VSVRDRLARRLREPPPGPFREGFWRSPLRGEWLTSVLGTLLVPAILIIALTGLISHDAYHGDLRGNAIVDPAHDIGILLSLPTSGPSWLYALTQGLHVTIGLITVPLLLAKLWSVIPKLFQWPAIRSPANALERLSLLLLVGGSLFEFATGVLNIQNYYPWHYSFVVAHYYGAWVFFSAFLLHVAIKTPTVLRAYRERGVLAPLREDFAVQQRAGGTISRRGFFGLIGGASLTILAVNIGESIGGPLRRLALLAPRGRVFGTGPNDFQVNRTAVAAGITPEQRAADRLADVDRQDRQRRTADQPEEAPAADRATRSLLDGEVLAQRRKHTALAVGAQDGRRLDRDVEQKRAEEHPRAVVMRDDEAVVPWVVVLDIEHAGRELEQ